ncbi:polysaccharide pyruvyl transferase family protein [Microbacterium sp. 18062]|uniref:polysaccharide pyruvyl transferase family protein n=1 Tax=Microbacterium sp. 18062 TaxID=2681410 RepID=UPI00135BEF85|nr:polysaccharide pyruvyl transferase family protein [Microbacterium sp. 18062]
MTVDVRGTNGSNMGAQLMLRAIVEKLSPQFRLSAPPQMTAFDTRARLGLRQTLLWNQFPRISKALGPAIPKFVQREFGLVDHRGVTGVVDASGFAYSDSFTRRRIRREAIFDAAWKSSGVPIVLLPQAFGPFEDQAKREWSRRVLNSASVVFARDRISLEYAQSLRVAADVRLCPDFTVPLAAPKIPSVSSEQFLAIVPNTKLVTTGKISEDSYAKLLIGYADAARKNGINALVIVHDAGDAAIAERIASMAQMGVFRSDDPLVLKAALSQAEMVVSSRFHAIVSALSGSVPTLALGWSHKYSELMHDFHVDNWVAGLDEEPEDALTRLSARPRDQIVDDLKQAKSEISAAVDSMWRLTIDTLAAG